MINAVAALVLTGLGGVFAFASGGLLAGDESQKAKIVGWIAAVLLIIGWVIR